MLWAAGGAPSKTAFDGFGWRTSPGIPRGNQVGDTDAGESDPTRCVALLAQGVTGWRAPPALRQERVVQGLARALVAGGDRKARCGRLLGHAWKWLAGLVDRYETRFAEERPRRLVVARWIANDAGFVRAWLRYGPRIRVADWVADAPEWLPVEAAVAWDLPRLLTVGDLAAWLRLRPGELEWFTDARAWAGKVDTGQSDVAGGDPLGHYFYRWVRKRSGVVRLLEEPKARMKTLQGAVLREILNRVPQHRGAHGFVRGRSIGTFAAPHVGRKVVLRMDLADFFPGIGRARVAGFFRLAGYPESVAERLAGLCTNAAPGSVLHGVAGARALYGRRHLPQGAPSSPALANVRCHRMDERLSGLAAAAGGVYTRYADDLAFSGEGDFTRGVQRFAAHVAAVILEEGFRVNHRKTRVMRQGVRQSLAGLVVNQRLGVGRAEYDALKALLHNCARTGAAAQNLDGRGDWRAHLTGRVGFVESIHAERGARLQAMLARIDW